MKYRDIVPLSQFISILENLLCYQTFQLIPGVNIIFSLFHSKSGFASFTFSADDNAVTLTEFEASPAGMIKSFITRFPGDNSVLEDLWKAEMPYHKM